MPGKQQQRKAASAVWIVGLALGFCGAVLLAAWLFNRPLDPKVRALTAPQCRTPSAAPAQSRDLFSIAVQTEAATLDPALKKNITRGAQIAYAQWRDWLGEDALLHSQVNIRFVGDSERFRQIYGKPDTEEWTTTGFYRMRSNEALILYSAEYRDAALGNAFHEISHLVTASHLGATPPWLNEGLAEYYETLEVVDERVRFAANLQHIQLLRSQGPLSVDDMTALSQKEWMQEDAQRRYASAWALITFMLQSKEGQRTLQNVLRQAYDQRCKSRPELRDSLRDHPGGLQSLQNEWLAWLDTRFGIRPPGSQSPSP